MFVSCLGHETLENVIANNIPKDDIQHAVQQKNLDYYEKLVLEQFWMPGSAMSDIRRSEHTLFKGIPAPERESVLKAIQSLRAKKILNKLNFCYELNMKHIEQVKKILGR